MIRPDEITYLVFDDIYNKLSKYKYEEIELSENNQYIFGRAKKSYGDHLFKMDFEYDDVSRIINITVYCLTRVPKDKRIFCLKLINLFAPFEKEAKYFLCPKNHIISCMTYHSFLARCSSMGALIEGHASCSIENLSETYDTIKNDDPKISDIHPIRFYNDFWKGIDFF
jgi:hypothetical protein